MLQRADEFLAGLFAGIEGKAALDVFAHQTVDAVIEFLHFAALHEPQAQQLFELFDRPDVWWVGNDERRSNATLPSPMDNSRDQCNQQRGSDDADDPPPDGLETAPGQTDGTLHIGEVRGDLQLNRLYLDGAFVAARRTVGPLA